MLGRAAYTVSSVRIEREDHHHEDAHRFHPLTNGEAFINGHPAGSVEARRSLGYSPERPSFYSDMTAWDYLVYMSRLSGMNLDAAEKRTKELLISLDLSRFYDAKVGGFSSGMKQRLSLAQAMAL